MDNMKQNKAAGHLAALLTIFIWGTTFISTKVLLRDFQPVEILFFRFVIGLAALAAACPRRIKGTTLRQELAFASAGLSGVCLYYLLENIALTYTMASNVGVIISVAPFFTGILSQSPVFWASIFFVFSQEFISPVCRMLLMSLESASLEIFW